MQSPQSDHDFQPSQKHKGTDKALQGKVLAHHYGKEPTYSITDVFFLVVQHLANIPELVAGANYYFKAKMVQGQCILSGVIGNQTKLTDACLTRQGRLVFFLQLSSQVTTSLIKYEDKNPCRSPVTLLQQPVLPENLISKYIHFSKTLKLL